MLFNVSHQFGSPTRQPGDITTHKNSDEKVKHCMDQLQAVSERGGPTGFGLDAKTGIVVDVDNMNLTSTRCYENPPAPQVGNPMHYDSFTSQGVGKPIPSRCQARSWSGVAGARGPQAGRLTVCSHVCSRT